MSDAKSEFKDDACIGTYVLQKSETTKTLRNGETAKWNYDYKDFNYQPKKGERCFYCQHRGAPIPCAIWNDYVFITGEKSETYVVMHENGQDKILNRTHFWRRIPVCLNCALFDQCYTHPKWEAVTKLLIAELRKSALTQLEAALKERQDRFDMKSKIIDHTKCELTIRPLHGFSGSITANWYDGIISLQAHYNCGFNLQPTHSTLVEFLDNCLAADDDEFDSDRRAMGL